MVDNSDGSYSATYTIPKPGDITMVIKYYGEGQSGVEYFDNTDFSGTALGSETITSLTQNYGSNSMYKGCNDPCSAKFIFKLKAPVTGIVTFQLTAQGLAILLKDGEFGTVSIANEPKIIEYTMIQDELYSMELRLVDESGDASVSLKWSYTGQASFIDIPSTNLYSPTIHGASPIDETSSCYPGYSVVLSGDSRN